MIRIYDIWGGVMGYDGVITSIGMQDLDNKLAKYGPVRSYLQESSYRCAKEIYSEAAKTDKVVLIGYSGGSVMATRICNSPLFDESQIVDLLVNIDGSPPGNMQRVGDNVRSILNIYDPNAWVFGGGIISRWRKKKTRAGGGIVTAPEDTKIKSVAIDMVHLAFQSSPVVHQIIIDEVAKL
jgi:hypothetical protein